ncbi:MAG: signal peptide peptidase SppA [Myxococcales bacterium]|jgi:protease-4|nr:signal peptide peptidase SppA [Myxococcales bacterium]
MPRLPRKPSLLLALLSAVSFLLPSAAFAQVSAVRQAMPTDGAPLPPTGAAVADDVMAPGTNPAGLASAKGFSLGYLHERDIPLDRIADALFLSLGAGPVSLGFSTHWMRYGDLLPNDRKTSWTLALGNEFAALGASINLFSSAQNRLLDRMITWDLGLTVRPFRYLAFGAAAFDLNAPDFGGARIARRFDIGLGFRPFTDRVELAVDWRFDDLISLDESALDITLRAEVLEGLVVLAAFTTSFSGERLAAQIGLELRLPNVAAGYALGAQFDDTRVASHQAWARFTTERQRGIDIAPKRYVLIDLERSAGAQSPLALLFGNTDPWLELLATLRRIGSDPDVLGVVIKMEGSGELGLARAEALREALLDMKARGKKIVSLLLGANDPDYLVAMTSDRIYAVAAANLLINGFSMSSNFMGRALHRMGIQMDAVRVGQFKSAPDRFTHSEMTEADLTQRMAWLNEVFPRYAAALAAARKLSLDRAYQVLNKGILGSNAALKAGLIDEVIFSDQLLAKLQEIEGRSVAIVEAKLPETDVPRAWGLRPKIALIRIDGLITGGESVGSPFGGQQTGAATVIRALQQVFLDDGYAALVLAIDSGGGSSLASDLVWRAVRLVAQKKPVVVSLGDVAASGGYYIASAGHEIFASPSTLTGSIGVFMLKPSFGKLMHVVGVNAVTLRRGESADLTSLVREWTGEEKAELARALDETYALFIDRVAEGRRMTREKVETLARGRIWSGTAAKANGLIDSIGGLDKAIAQARVRSGLLDKEIEVEVLGKGGFGERLKTVWPMTQERHALQKLLGELDAGLLLFLLEEEGKALALTPDIGPMR